MSAASLVALFKAKGLTIATAESCTGGLIAAAITAVPGASAVLTHGFVTYANTAKTAMLGVPAALIEEMGAVSEEVARCMADGARARSGADFTVSVTGIAGPDGGTAETPVGTVWFGLAGPHGTTTYHHIFQGDRSAIRAQSVDYALRLLEEGGNE
ncbi:MAG: CinA family protein [Acidocella sp.]|nr:CinA family protein [Acidocella sp.]